MKALVYNGARDVSVSDVEDSKIELPTDVVIKLTTTNICGSDLHMYDGRTDIEEGRVLGHENLGEIIEVGDAVTRVKKGDLVCLPFNISCSFCKNCERGLTGYCLTANPAPRARRTGLPAGARIREVRLSCCASRTPISTVCCCRRMRRRMRTTT